MRTDDLRVKCDICRSAFETGILFPAVFISINLDMEKAFGRGLLEFESDPFVLSKVYSALRHIQFRPAIVISHLVIQVIITDYRYHRGESITVIAFDYGLCYFRLIETRY